LEDFKGDQFSRLARHLVAEGVVFPPRNDAHVVFRYA
jgi:hypothetical protein